MNTHISVIISCVVTTIVLVAGIYYIQSKVKTSEAYYNQEVDGMVLTTLNRINKLNRVTDAYTSKARYGNTNEMLSSINSYANSIQMYNAQRILSREQPSTL